MLICFTLVGDFYCYDNPAALKCGESVVWSLVAIDAVFLPRRCREPLRQRFGDQFDSNEFENMFALLYSVYAPALPAYSPMIQPPHSPAALQPRAVAAMQC